MSTEQERAEFEAWYEWEYSEAMPCGYSPHGYYLDARIQLLFRCWQAGRAALQSQDREDEKRLDWLQQHDERFYNLLRITSIVNKGFSPTNSSGKRWFSSIREAIDHARRIGGGGDEHTRH